MAKDLKELRNKRGKLVADARALLDRADAEKRNLTDEEKRQWDTMMVDQDRIADEITREERQLELDRKMAEETARSKETKNDKEERKSPRDTEEYRAAFQQLLRGGKESLGPDQIRALSSGIGSEGGFLVLPQQTAAGLIKAIDDEVLIRQWATKFSVPNAASLGAASLDADPADADWTTELATGNEDSTMALGKRELSPNPLAKRIKVSNKLLRQVPNVEALVMGRLAYKFGITEEKAFLTGNGAKKPLGLFTASNDGIGTARDVVTGSATDFTFDGLINAKYSLKGGYLRNAKWLFHRDGVSKIAKLKDTTNNYLWQPSKKDGEPDMLLGLPVYQSEYVPNTFTTGLYVGMLADFSYYWIADALDIQVQRLNELYAENNQAGFIGRKETDGMPVLAEAFARIKTS